MVLDEQSSALSTNSLCYEAVQRTLRNTGVSFLRQMLSEAFPQDHLEKLRRPFKDEWDDLRCAAESSRTSGGTTTHVRDDYDLLSVSHFYSLFDTYYEKIFANAVQRGVVTSKPSRPKLLGALKAIKDFRDPLSHPVEEDVSVEEALGVLTDVRQVLLALGQKAKADQVAGQITYISKSLPATAPNVICILPTQDSIYQDFIGRDSILNDLSNTFESRFTKRCLLAGDGGKGKSALAYRFAQKIASETTYFKMIVWVSAKKRKFEAGHVTDISNPDFVDYPSAVDALLSQYGPVDSSADLVRKKALLLECLDDYPTLIIADDIDTVLDSTEVVSLFTFDIPNTASKVLLTSRRDIPGIASITVEGFALPEAELFIQSKVSSYSLDVQEFTPNVIRTIREACDGSPLYIDDLMRLARVVGPKKAAQAWAEKRGDEARRYALKRELDFLSQDAKTVLIAAVVTDESASFAHLQSMLSFSDERLISSLTELQTLFLLPNARLVEGEQRYHLNLNTKRLILASEGSSDLFKRLRLKSKALSGTLPTVSRDVIGQFIRQALLFVNGGNASRGEELLLAAIDKYPNAPDLYSFLAYLYKGQHQITDARIYYKKAADLNSKSEDMYLHWAKMEMGAREFNSALSATSTGLRHVPSSFAVFLLQVEARHRVAEDYGSRVQPEKAERLWREVVDDIEKRLNDGLYYGCSDPESRAVLFKWLVIALERSGDIPELNKRFKQWCGEHKGDPLIPTYRELFARRRGSLFKS